MLSSTSSIKAQMMLYFIGTVTALAVVYGALSISSLTSLSEQQVELNEARLKDSVVASMKDAGHLASNKVTELVTESFVPAISLANTLASTAHPNASLDREMVMTITAAALESSNTISAMYSQFEPNGYDNKDNQWRNNTRHSTPTGTLEIYYVKESGKAVLYPVDDPQEKYLSEQDENGIREAEWYLCSRDTRANCALDPYLYEIEPGNEELMTTLSAPILVNGQFRGIVGVDINLPIVQQWVEEQAAQLFNGNSHITLVSQRNLIIASTQFKSDLTQSISSVSQSMNKLLAERSDFFQLDNEWVVKVPVNIRQADTTWTLLVSVPKNVALATVNEMKSNAEDNLYSTTIKLVTFSILSLAAGFAVAFWLTKSISSPIRRVSESIAELADREGDLTQVVEIRKHKELITLADGFNRFMKKLAEMISVSKQNVTELSGQFEGLHQISNEVEKDTQSQQYELDNVATAVTQMAAAASEVARIAATTASGSGHAANLLQETQAILQDSVERVTELAKAINTSSEQVSQVANRSADITSIVVTIQGIAEQTNLLALNAAIEAARAGEQGRGFAVVADEVRNLAARTQSSTQEISSLIENLQSDVTTAVTMLEQTHGSVSGTVEKTTGSFTRLTETLESVNEISHGSEQVASAAQEQSLVSEDINKRLVLVSDSSKQLADLGNQLKDKSLQSKSLIGTITEQLSRLKV
ncbi:methyl-accepting chemotaxis protein [Alteromonas facilis]|uniref:methyl-accepting chemotaxis protein n=1 Tax=Alteromonas facilis TaxID=2048004 RepID=UPI000C2814D6|nr:methyl-accepting chemotaxis protein [Alteromonas facilis]